MLGTAYDHLVKQMTHGLPLEFGVNNSVFRFKDAFALSGNPQHQGKYVMQERRRGCRLPFNHWGFMVDKPARD